MIAPLSLFTMVGCKRFFFISFLLGGGIFPFSSGQPGILNSLFLCFQVASSRSTGLFHVQLLLVLALTLSLSPSLHAPSLFLFACPPACLPDCLSILGIYIMALSFQEQLLRRLSILYYSSITYSLVFCYFYYLLSSTYSTLEFIPS